MEWKSPKFYQQVKIIQTKKKEKLKSTLKVKLPDNKNVFNYFNIHWFKKSNVIKIKK